MTTIMTTIIFTDDEKIKFLKTKGFKVEDVVFPAKTGINTKTFITQRKIKIAYNLDKPEITQENSIEYDFSKVFEKILKKSILQIL